MGRRPSKLFRGSELPRLLILAGIMLAGWSMVVVHAGSDAVEEAPPQTVPVEKLTPVVPDEGVEFQAIKDKAPVQVRESAAYATLLERARTTPAADLARQARRDLFYTHLWERPEKYRGVPIHLEGTAKKILTYEVEPSMSPSGRLYEVWFYSDENRSFPYVVMLQDPPAGLAIGHELNLRVSVDGYFMKLLGYRAGDNLRAAPMLVGRMRFKAAPAAAPSPLVELNRFSKQHALAIFLAIVGGYVALRLFFQLRKAFAPARTSALSGTAREELAPGEVVDWLNNLPETQDDLDEGEPDPRPRPGLTER